MMTLSDNPLLFSAIIFFITLCATAAIEKTIIPRLTSSAPQPIYTEGPAWHSKKSGTPTMGGIAFLIAALLSLSIASLFFFFSDNREAAISLTLTMAFALINALIGIVDDLAKIRKKENEGLLPRQKLFLQFLAALAFLLARRLFLYESSVVYFGFGSFDLGVFYYPVLILAILGTVNCANLTDGVDGLASSVAFSVGIALSYLGISASAEVGIIGAVMTGAALGFLIFNLHPARIFMGDTGSLFLGALAVCGAISLGNIFLIIPLGIVFLIEGASVIIQVIVFKLTGRRVFRMAPLHHHLEKCGFSENKIVLCAIFTTLIFSVLAGILYL